MKNNNDNDDHNDPSSSFGTYGISRNVITEKKANQQLSELQKKQSKRSKQEKALIGKYNVDQQQSNRMKQIEQDDIVANTPQAIKQNSRLNEYQKRSLSKRLNMNQIPNKANKSIKSKLQTYKTKRYEAAVASADAQIVLNTESAGFLQTERDMERTTNVSQTELKRAHLDENTSRHVYDLQLPHFGPYGCQYDRSGRYSIIYGQRGHVAVMDAHSLQLHSEFHLRERIRDVTFLHNHGLMAIAQQSHVYIYDDTGVEIHKLQDHIDPFALQFLPYHWLLASIGRSGYLKYQDTSTGELVSQHRTRLGPCHVMRQNPQNAIINLGHSNGTVTMWSPSSSQYLVKLLCHKGSPITSMAIDISGNYMVTGGNDRQIKIWDLRKYQCTHSYFSVAGPPTSIDISQRGVLGIGHAAHTTFWSPDSIKKKVKDPYMYHAVPGCGPIETLRFRPFEDVCVIGHNKGISSIVIPGSGEPNLDTTEYNLNPYQDKKQRREADVRALLDKLDPNMITINPNDIGGMEESTPEIRNERLRDIQEEADAKNTRKPKKEKTKKRGRSKIQTQLRRKQRNVVDEQVIKLRKAREREKDEEQVAALGSGSDKNTSPQPSSQQHLSNAKDIAPPALKRFF